MARLRVLMAVAEHGSVTATAKALDFAQPSVSHHLTGLQAEAGVQLITHVGRSIRLAPDGEALHDAHRPPRRDLDRRLQQLSTRLRVRLQGCRFTPNIRYTSDDVIVSQALVAAGLGVTTTPGMALRLHHATGVQATAADEWQRRIYIATFGEPPLPTATSAFITALRGALTPRWWLRTPRRPRRRRITLKRRTPRRASGDSLARRALVRHWSLLFDGAARGRRIPNRSRRVQHVPGPR